MSNKTSFIQSSGTYLHVYNRGVNREPLFFDSDNYYFFLQRLNDYLPDSGISIIAYCLMPNHFHLLVHQHRSEAISRYVGRVCKSYVQAINKRKNRTGHLFENKYKAKLIDDVAYLLHLSRYIHLNPVRAGLVEKVGDWPYSSYESFIDRNDSSVCVEPQVILQEFKEPSEYRDFIESYRQGDKEKILKYLF